MDGVAAAERDRLPVKGFSGTPEEIERQWYEQVYRGRGDSMRQLTWRAVIMGSVLGGVLSLTNLYIGLKAGWGFGVAITACILSYAIWTTLHRVGVVGTPMTILENNCMQSTASSAGYSTGGTLISAFAAYMLVSNTTLSLPLMLAWVFLLAVLGVTMAIPMKRQMINIEQLRFPSGIAAAETLHALHSTGSTGMRSAKALGWAALVAATGKLWAAGIFGVMSLPNIGTPPSPPHAVGWGVPYRVDVARASDAVLDRLVELGALDVDRSPGGGVAALMPDGVAPEQVARAVGVDDLSISPAVGRDAESVWILTPRATRIGRLRIVPANASAEPGALRLTDSAAFGTGLHPTTAMCLEAIEEALQHSTPGAVLDVGTGSGVLALAALLMGVPRALGLDIDAEALRAAAENARLNGLDRRLQLTRGGPDAVAGTWPLVVANLLAAPIVELAPVLVRRVGHHGRLMLAGIASSAEKDVDRAYRRLGMQHVLARSRAGWSALVLQASW